jgi:hypothetical protein
MDATFTLLQFGPVGDEVCERGTGHKDRACPGQTLWVHWRTWPLDPPKSTSVPRSRRAAREPSIVLAPTPNPVISSTLTRW